MGEGPVPGGLTARGDPPFPSLGSPAPAPRMRRTSAAERSEAVPLLQPVRLPPPRAAPSGDRSPDGRPRQRPFLEGLKPSCGARAGEGAEDRCSRLAPQHFRATPVYKGDALFVSQRQRRRELQQPLRRLWVCLPVSSHYYARNVISSK